MKPRVFIGYTNIAGVSIRLKKAFNNIGVKADFYSKDVVISKYNYTASESYKILSFSRFHLIMYFQKIYYLILFLFKYDYFIYLSTRSGLISGKKEIKFLKSFGKKFMILYTGCDARIPELVQKYKWNTCKDCTNEYKKFVGCEIPSKIELLNNDKNLFDIILSPDECSGYFGNKYITTYFPVNISEYKIYPVLKNTKLRILHAPTDEGYKGTRYINSVMQKLSENYSFDFLIKKNLSLEELYSEIKISDLIIDQMLVGFYGLFAIESMAFGKPVICYIHPDIWEKIKIDCPVINANPDSLYSVLENLSLNPELLRDIGLNSRLYVEKYHNADSIAKDYLSYFKMKKGS
jgi:hypothetical protein